jgi:NTE family protein
MRVLHRLSWKLRPPVLALGGGGARGFAHIGVLQVLEEEAGLRPRAIAGTSMGAVIGAMYLIHGSAQAVIERWQETIEKKLIPTVPTLAAARERGAREHPLLQAARRIKSRVVISMAVSRSTMLDGAPLAQALDVLLPDIDIKEIGLPFAAVATDLATGEVVALTEGPLRTAIQASSSIPGLVPAVEIGGRVLVDGAVKAEVPVAVARRLGRPVVAVDVSIDLPPLSIGGLVLDTMMRTQLMTSMQLRRLQLRSVRRVIRPNVGHATWSEWDRFYELVEAGREATRAWLDQGLLSRFTKK